MLAQWKVSRLELVDMVAPPSFLSRALPALAAEPLSVPIFVQVRADISREDVRLAKAAGMELQCGIESLNDGVLESVNKGTGMLENLRFLKWCAEEGVELTWPMLYGFPQEDHGQYADICALMPSIQYLPPPSELGAVLTPRFSAYFNEPGAHGLGPATTAQALPSLVSISRHKREAHRFVLLER